MEQSNEMEKPKQYLLMVDQLNMVLLSKMMPTLLFVEVEGYINGDGKHQFLVNPLPQKDEEQIVEPTI